jgi:NAD kinase
MAYDKLVLVTRKTRLEELVARFNTRAQARFYIEHMGLDFGDYEREHEAYLAALAATRGALSGLLPKLHEVERALLPNFLFSPGDLVAAVGQDGLVVNAAKYVGGRPILAVNPDPSRYDGVLLPFNPARIRRGAEALLRGRARVAEITMAEASLNDGQALLAFNDFLVGHRTHASALYRLAFRGREEPQSSSGILISTGAGSTGWLSSAQNMAEAVAGLLAGRRPSLPRLRLEWSDPRLAFVVREPFLSRASAVGLAAGLLEAGEALTIESRMPEGGVIFSDGVEADAVAFNAGAVATIRAAKERARLVLAD